MNDERNFEDDVRAALKAVEPGLSLDPARVIRRGRRLRYRRQAATGGVALGMAAAVSVPIALANSGASIVATGPSVGPSAAGTSGTAAVSYTCPAPGEVRKPGPDAYQFTDKFWGPGPTVVGRPAGDPICPGDFSDHGEVAFWMGRENPIMVSIGQPGYNLWEGRINPRTGKLEGIFQSVGFTDRQLAQRRPGFVGLAVDGGWERYLMGMYLGPVADIDFRVVGRKLDVRIVKWSKDPNVSVVWSRIPAGLDVNRLVDSIYQKPGDVKIVARDADGRPLPLGDTEVMGG